MKLAQAQIRRFADMEVFVEILENVRGEDVFVMQSTSFPANDNLMELLITLDAAPLLGAADHGVLFRILVMREPDRKTAFCSPISAKLVANLITEGGCQPGADHGPARGADSGLLRSFRWTISTPRRCSAATSRSVMPAAT